MQGRDIKIALLNSVSHFLYFSYRVKLHGIQQGKMALLNRINKG